MGLKDFFSSSGRAKSRLDRQIKTATQPYGQSSERYAAMDALLRDGSEEALVGVFRRFTIVSTKSIEDEEEKGWAYRKLVDLGPAVLPAAKRFCLEAENVAWGLRVVEDVADEAQEWDILDALLAKHPPGYERDPTKKKQILTHLADIDDPKVAGLLARYLEDPDEGIRHHVVEQLVDIEDPKTKEALVNRLCSEEEDSLRIKNRILDGFATLGWDISEQKTRIGKVLGHEHAIRDGKIVRI